MTQRASEMPTPPLVSIGVPTCDRARLLHRALHSLVAQDYPNLEIVVSDNASTDDTPAICEDMRKRHPNIRYFRVPVRTPPFANFRNALVPSQGIYFMWAADDDLWERHFVSTLVKQLELTRDIMLVAAEAQYVLHDGTKLPFFPEGTAFYAPLPSSRLRRILTVSRHAYGNLIYGLYRREALVGHDGRTVLDACRFTNEIPLFIQVADRGGIRVCDRILLYKTTTFQTFLQAAREYGFVPQVDLDRSGEHADPRSNPPWLHRCLSTLVYHVRTLADIQRALWRIDAGLGTRVVLLLLFGVLVGVHFLKLAVAWPLEDALRKRVRVF